MARTVLELSPGEGVRVFGPATLTLEEGAATILGVDLSPGSEARVEARRSYYVQAISRARIAADLGPGARLEAPSPGEEPMPVWIREVDSILESCQLPCRIVVLGPTDSGKTSLAALTANRAFAAGLRPYIIDADIGQADIGPPGFVSGSLPERPVLWLRELEPDRMVFVGHVEPGHVQGQIVHGLYRLLQRAEEASANTIIVDTDGWVEGWHALESKMNMLRILNPHAVIVMGSEELYRFVRARWPGRVLKLPSPAVIARRTRQDRASLRSENYKRFLEGSSMREFSLDRTPIINACIPPRPPARHGKPSVIQYPGGVCAFYDRPDPPPAGEAKRLMQEHGVREAMIVYSGGFQGVLVGLTDTQGWDHPGIVESLDTTNGILRVRTRYLGPVRLVVAGRIRVKEDYLDTGARRVWV